MDTERGSVGAHAPPTNLDLLAWFSEDERHECRVCDRRTAVTITDAAAAFCLACATITIDGEPILGGPAGVASPGSGGVEGDLSVARLRTQVAERDEIIVALQHVVRDLHHEIENLRAEVAYGAFALGVSARAL